MGRWSLFLLAGLAIASQAAAQKFEYIVENIGVLNGETASVGRGINNQGDVVGWSGYVPFLFTDANGIVSLGSYPSAQITWAIGINDIGNIVGGGRQSTTEFVLRHTGSGWQNLNLGFSYAWDINNLGQIVGTRGSSTFSQQAYIWDPATGATNITPGVAKGINDDSWVVGYNDLYLGFLSKPGLGVQTITGPAGFPRVYPTAINNEGLVAGDVHNGRSGTSSQSRIFIYRDGAGMTVLGGLGALNEVWGLNESGEMVGLYYPAANNSSYHRAYLYTPAKGFRDLNSLVDPAGGWVLLWAFGINDRGQIVCDAFNNLIPGHRGARLTPIPRGDVNMNGCVDDTDLALLLNAFGMAGNDLPSDLNGDQSVDDRDLAILLENFGAGC